MITTTVGKEKGHGKERKEQDECVRRSLSAGQSVDVAQGFAVLPLPSSATFELIAE